MATTKTTDLSAKLHVAGMSATVLAMGTGFCSQAQADPVITDVNPNVNIANGTYALDLNGDQIADFVLLNNSDPQNPSTGSFAFDFVSYDTGFNTFGKNAIEKKTGGDQYKAYDNDRGDTVGTLNSFSPLGAKLRSNDGIGGSAGYWPEGEQRFLGLQFEISNGETSTHYGFAGLTLAEGTLAIDLDCYGYETAPGKEIEKTCTTSVPEPASLLLLAAGAVPLLALRRRRPRH